jgi:hypothetical protein
MIEAGPNRLVVHCGFPKTGTTAIQQICVNNRDSLLKNSFLYPHSAIPKSGGEWEEYGHHNIPLSFLESYQHYRHQPKNGSFEAVLKEWSQSGARNILLSSEEFMVAWSAYPDALGEKLLRLFRFFEICVIFVVRNFSDFLESAYLQKLKDWSLQRVLGPINAFGYEIYDLNTYTWYSGPIDNARRILGDRAVKVLPYEADVTGKFFGAVGIEMDKSTIKEQSPTINQRISAKHAALLQILSTSPKAELYQARLTGRDYWDILHFESDDYKYNIANEEAAKYLFDRSVELSSTCTDIPMPTRLCFDNNVKFLSAEIFSSKEVNDIESIFGKGCLLAHA